MTAKHKYRVTIERWGADHSVSYTDKTMIGAYRKCLEHRMYVTGQSANPDHPWRIGGRLAEDFTVKFDQMFASARREMRIRTKSSVQPSAHIVDHVVASLTIRRIGE